MFGGIAVAGNLLCVAFTRARGHLFLVDLEDGRLVSHWAWGGEDGFGDAGGCAIDADHTIWVADPKADRVRRFSPFGRELDEIGQQPVDGHGSVRSDRPGILNRPRAVAVRGDTVFVAQGERWLRHGVQRFRRDGSPLDPLHADGDVEGRFGCPRGVAVDQEGVYVADTQHGVIQRFRLDGRFVGRIEVAVHEGPTARPVAVLPLGGGALLVADDGDEPGLRRIDLDQRPTPVGGALGSAIVVGLCRDARDHFYALDADGFVHRFPPDLSESSTLCSVDEFG